MCSCALGGLVPPLPGHGTCRAGTGRAFRGKIRVVRMEVDEQEELAEGFGLVGVPTFILYKDGEEKGRIIGYRMKAKFFEELEGLMK